MNSYIKAAARWALIVICVLVGGALGLVTARAAATVDAVIDCGTLVGSGVVRLNIDGEARYLRISCGTKV
jgi:hypothetical protein